MGVKCRGHCPQNKMERGHVSAYQDHDVGRPFTERQETIVIGELTEVVRRPRVKY